VSDRRPEALGVGRGDVPNVGLAIPSVARRAERMIVAKVDAGDLRPMVGIGNGSTVIDSSVTGNTRPEPNVGIPFARASRSCSG
jgi:hypothetical protein